MIFEVFKPADLAWSFHILMFKVVSFFGTTKNVSMNELIIGEGPGFFEVPL